jgi:hypothetical protein
MECAPDRSLLHRPEAGSLGVYGAPARADFGDRERVLAVRSDAGPVQAGGALGEAVGGVGDAGLTDSRARGADAPAAAARAGGARRMRRWWRQVDRILREVAMAAAERWRGFGEVSRRHFPCQAGVWFRRCDVAARGDGLCVAAIEAVEWGGWESYAQVWL